MPVQVANAARRDPRRPRVLPSAAISRRGELTAALATAAAVAQVVIAPVTLLVSIVLAVVGRVARWRPGWLAAPALAWLTWTSYQPVDRAGPSRRLALVISLHWGFGLLPAVLVVPYSTKATESSLAQVPTGYREDAEALGPAAELDAAQDRAEGGHSWHRHRTAGGHRDLGWRDRPAATHG